MAYCYGMMAKMMDMAMMPMPMDRRAFTAVIIC